MSIKEIQQQYPELIWPEDKLKDGDWVCTIDPVFTAEREEFKVFQYDSRINYSIHFGGNLRFFKLQEKPLPF